MSDAGDNDEADDAGDLEADAAAITASLDQTAAALSNMARLVAGYYVALRIEGVEGDHAAMLASDYQSVVLESMTDDG